MPATRTNDPAELLRRALDGLDAQIAELRATRAQLAAMIDQPSTVPNVKAAAPQKHRKLSAAARAKISAAAKARWGRERKAKSKAPKPKRGLFSNGTKMVVSTPVPIKAVIPEHSIFS
jgi:hypothetical protein